MSYILDALRKADAERDRGSVPGLHAQTSPASAEDASPQRLPPWTWAVGGGALMLIAAMAWQLMGRDADTPAPVVSAAPVAMTAPVPAETDPPPVTPAPVAVAQAASPPAQVAPPERLPAPVPVPARPRPAPVAAPTVRDNPPPARKPEPAAPQAVAAAAPADTAPAAESRIYTLNELPADVRRELPALSVGGSIYSDNAASRFLIINGQIFHENDKVAPNLTLEQIKLKAAVLKYKGYRYSIGF